MKKTTPYPSKLAEYIARHACLILNLKTYEDFHTPSEKRKKKNNDIAVKEFLDELVNRVLPTSDGLFLAVFETGNPL